MNILQVSPPLGGASPSNEPNKQTGSRSVTDYAHSATAAGVPGEDSRGSSLLPGFTLPPYQVAGCDFLTAGLGAGGRVVRVLADEVGLGKSVQACAAAREVLAHPAPSWVRGARVLIVVPRSLMGQWQSELERFLGVSDAVDLSKVPKSDPIVLDQPRQVALISPQSLKNSQVIDDFKPEVLIVDEVSDVKRVGVQVSGQPDAGVTLPALRKLAARVPVVWGLTATMLEMSPVEPWGVLWALDAPGLPDWQTLRSWLEWVDAHQLPDGNWIPPEAVGYTPDGLVSYRALLDRFVLKRRAEQVGIELPQRVGEQVEWVPLTGTQAKAHGKASKQSGQYGYQRKQAVYYGAGEASQVVARAIEWISANHPGEKVVLFSERKEGLGQAEDMLADAGITFTRYDGGMTEPQRVKSLESFKDPDGALVLLGTSALERGLNLQHCRVLVTVMSRHNPAREVQREGRIRRFGSPHDTYVHMTFNPDTQDYRQHWEQLARREQYATQLGI